MAYDDIATLGIRADTSNLSKAISKLEELKNAAQKTETATEQFSRKAQAAAKSADAMT